MTRSQLPNKSTSDLWGQSRQALPLDIQPQGANNGSGGRHSITSSPRMRKSGGNDRAAASGKGQPEGTDRFGGIFLGVHGALLQGRIE